MLAYATLRKNTRLFYATICFAVLISILHVIFRPVLLNMYENETFTSFAYWLGIDTFSLFNLLFYFTLPLFVTFTYVATFKADLENGFVHHVRMHVPFRKYYFSSAKTAFCLGFTVVACALIVNFLLSNVFLSHIQPDDLLNSNLAIQSRNMMFVGLYFNYPLLHVFLYIIFASVFGGLLTAFSLVSSVFFKNKLIVLLLPFLLQMVLYIINYTIFPEYAIAMFTFLPEMTLIFDLSKLIVFITFISILTVTIILYFIGVRYYETNL